MSTNDSATKKKKVARFSHRIKEKYQINNVLGEGATATVYSATVIATQQKVALKVFQKKGLSPDAEHSLHQEYEILSSIQHPNIIQAYELISDEHDAYYMPLEFMSGGELFDRIVQKQKYSEKDARDLVKVLLGAIKYIHSKHIIHRDLKPENLLLVSQDEDSNVKIADFGFAIHAHGFTTTTQCGTLGYLAPEIVERRPYGALVDMWAFGVILYILLGGYQPFFGDNEKELFRRIVNAEYEFHEPFWSNVSENAKDLIRKLLVINPHVRYTAEQAADHIWLQQDDSVLASRILTDNLSELKKFQAHMKFKGAVDAVIFFNRLKRVGRDHHVVPSLKYGSSHNSAIVSLIEDPNTLHSKYAIDDTELGQGAFSVVKVGQRKVDQYPVAIKIVNKSKIVHGMGILELKAEVQMLQGLLHPNIVAVLDFFEEDSECYIVMEQLRGGELFDLISTNKCFNEKDARNLAYTILVTIKYLHDRNVVHRDLKPENLLMTSADVHTTVKLADFGFAVKDEGNQLTGQVGTVAYMAPEILLKKSYGKPVDMWAFGVILYIMLCGSPPFHHDDEPKLIQQILNCDIIFPKAMQSVSIHAKSMIYDLLNPDPRRRLTVDQALQHEWINERADDLEVVSLESNVADLKKYQIKKKFRTRVKGIMAVNRMQKLLGFRSASTSHVDAMTSYDTSSSVTMDSNHNTNQTTFALRKFHSENSEISSVTTVSYKSFDEFSKGTLMNNKLTSEESCQTINNAVAQVDIGLEIKHDS